MDELALRDFVRIVGGDLPVEGDGTTIEHVATHSGRIRRRAAFFALGGAQCDGHSYLGEAVANGAVALVVKRGALPQFDVQFGVPVVAVDDPLESLQRLAGWWRRSLLTRFVAVVGSNGKTVTKDCLVRLLSRKSPVYGSPGSYNSQLGVPLAVLDCPRTASVAVIEIAVSDPGEMTPLAGIVQPDVVVVTNIGSRWRYRFSDPQQHVEEILTIARELPPDGWIIFGEDDADVIGLAGDRVPAFVKGVSPALPAFRRTFREPDTMELSIAFPDAETSTVAVRTPSAEILTDVELAATTARLLGVDPSSIIEELQGYEPTSTRMEHWRSPSGVTLVRDVATPDPIAVSSALRAARRLVRQGSRMVVVLAGSQADMDETAEQDLVTTLFAEGADEVVGLSMSPLRATIQATRGLGGTFSAQSFPSVETLREYLLETLTSGDVALIQSRPGTAIVDVSRSLIEAMAPTRLYLDMSAMEENVSTFRRLVGPSVRIMAMVKALAYGTDIVEVSRGLAESGVDSLGVSGADEGAALRRAGINLPILVLMGTEEEFEKMVRYRLTPLLYSESMVDSAIEFAASSPSELAVHIEVDTGMHRSGLDWDDTALRLRGRSACACLRQLAAATNITIEGMMTHMASADDPAQDEFTQIQLNRFEVVARTARALGMDPYLHAAATAATIRIPAARHDMVRIGLGLFGLHPSPATAELVQLEPVVSLVSRLVQVLDVPGGEGVGYNSSWLAPPGGGRVGVVPAGYHDCVPRSFSNVGYVIINGTRCPIVGRVSMDSMNVDVSRCPDASVGAEVLIYGRWNGNVVPLEEVSRAIGTIPYEVMARVGPRVQRIITRH